MTTVDPDVVVFRNGTEGLSTEEYAMAIRDRLTDVDVALARTPHEERKLIRTARYATGTSIDEALLDVANELELFQAASSGYNHLPMEELAERGVRVANAAGIHAPGIAEQALGFCLVFARRIHEGWTRKRDGEWRHYKAGEFTGSTVTVVGLGAIGKAFVDRLQGMDVQTIGVRYTPEKGGPTDEVVGFDDRDVHDALSRTDYLLLATPLTETTEQLIGSEELATLPPEAVVINVGRGGVVDTQALLQSLQTEGIRGAALDVTDPEPLPADHPLWTLNNVLLTPHMGGHTPEHWNRLADIFAQNVRALERDEEESLRNLVNDPVGDR
jgi:phosphoglycerate dehydrogenase-like enzyme